MDYPNQDLNQATDARTNRQAPLSPIAACRAADLAPLRAVWSKTPAIPKLVASRDEGDDASWPGFDVRTLLRGEESAGRWSFHSLILAPGARLPAHVRDDGACYWFVVRGDAEVTIAGRVQRLHERTFAFAPAGVTQGVANTCSQTVEVLLGCAPAGTERAFAAAHELWLREPDCAPQAYLDVLSRYGFRFTGGVPTQEDARLGAASSRIAFEVRRPEDFAALRHRWTELLALPKIAPDPHACHDIAVAGQETRLMLSPEESAGQASVFYLGVAPGFGAPLHHQPGEEEFFFVLDGGLQLTIGDRQTQAAPTGAFAFAPRFATHAFFNAGERTLAMFSLNSPGGHNRGFEMAATQGGSPEFPQLIAAHGFQFHQPLGGAHAGDDVDHGSGRAKPFPG